MQTETQNQHATMNAPALKVGHTHDLIEEAKRDGLPRVRLWRSRMTEEDGETALFDLEAVNEKHAWVTIARIGHPSRTGAEPVGVALLEASGAAHPDNMKHAGAFSRRTLKAASGLLGGVA